VSDFLAIWVRICEQAAAAAPDEYPLLAAWLQPAAEPIEEPAEPAN